MVLRETDKRLLISFVGLFLVVLAPFLLFLWLLLNPDINAAFPLPHHHFYIVTIVSLISLGVALLVARAGVEIREFRVLFFGMGFMAMSGFFAIHSLSTPRFLLQPLSGYAGSVVALSGYLSLLSSALLFAASVTPFPFLTRMRSRSVALGLVGAVPAVLVVFGVTSFIWPEFYAQVPVSFPSGSYIAGGATVVLLAFASWRSFAAYTLTRLPAQWALATAFILLAEAQVSMALSPTWSLAWWQYHVLMLAGAGTAMAGLLVQYNKVASVPKIMQGIFGMESLVEIELSHGETIAALAAATEAKDPYTKGHTLRVANKAVALGKALNLPNESLRVLARAGLLHDIGKLGIPDSILLKPGPLTPSEFEVIKKHPGLGLEILKRVGSLEREVRVIRAHHERLDGNGYPDGLSGDKIPIEARVLAVADVCDSLASDRPYRKRLPMDQVREILLAEAESHLDPRVVELCVFRCDHSCADKK